MTYWMRSTAAVVALTVGLFAATRQAAATPIYDSGGYEAPRFTSGELSGQDVIQGPWAKDDGTGVATIQSAVVNGGTQAVQLQRPASANGDTRYGVLKLVSPLPPNQIIQVSWDMRVNQTQVGGVQFGPFFGVEGYDAFGAIKLIGSLGVDASTGDVLYQSPDGSFAETAPSCRSGSGTGSCWR